MVDAAAHVGVGSAHAARPWVRRRANALGWGAFLGLVVLALFGPLAILVAFSFNDSSILAFPFEGFTIEWYRQALA